MASTFAVYVPIIAKKQLQNVPDLMGYQIVMLEARNEYQNNRWMAYDRRLLLPILAASGQLLNLLFGILPLRARPVQAIVGTASACFTFQKIASLLLPPLPFQMTQHHTKLQADLDSFDDNGMHSMLRAVSFQITAMLLLCL